MLKEKLKYFFEKRTNNKVFSTSDTTLFIQKQDAVAHGKTLEDPNVLTHLRDGAESEEDSSKEIKLTPAELKALKDKAIAEYTEFFGEAPKGNLSGAKIQALVDAKKAEIAKEQNP